MTDHESNAYDVRLRTTTIGLGSDRDIGSLTAYFRYEIRWRAPDGHQAVDVGKTETWLLMTDVASRATVDLKLVFNLAGRGSEAFYAAFLNHYGAAKAAELLYDAQVLIVDGMELSTEHQGHGVALNVMQMLRRLHPHTWIALRAVPTRLVPDEEEDLTSVEDDDFDDRLVDDAGADRLRLYFARVGFERVGSSYFIVSPPR